jgi:hypothetical protein
MLTEAIGIPLAIASDGANRHDMKPVENTLGPLLAARPTPMPAKPQDICLDIIKGFDFTAHIRARNECYRTYP